MDFNIESRCDGFYLFTDLFLFGLVYSNGFISDCICAYTAQDYLQQELIRENLSARQAQRKPITQKKSVKEQIRRISVIRDRF